MVNNYYLVLQALIKAYRYKIKRFSWCLTVKLLTGLSSREFTHRKVAWKPGEPGFMKYDKYVMPDSSSNHGDARYSGSSTAGILNSRWAISMARRQFSMLLFLSEKKKRFALYWIWDKSSFLYLTFSNVGTDQVGNSQLMPIIKFRNSSLLWGCLLGIPVGRLGAKLTLIFEEGIWSGRFGNGRSKTILSLILTSSCHWQCRDYLKKKIYCVNLSPYKGNIVLIR